MARTRLRLHAPETRLEVEPVSRERAVVGETYGLSFRGKDGLQPCIMLFLDAKGWVLHAEMAMKGIEAPPGSRWVEAFKWRRG